MPNNKKALIVVAKQPFPGKTKTRLSPPLKPEQASALYECFLLDTLEQMRRVKEVQRILAYLPFEGIDYFQTIAQDFALILQVGHDLGSRLDNTLNKYLSAGFESAVIMNSDSPTLPAEYLTQAFEALSGNADVVLGPCDDGGYYLIGVKKPAPRLMREIKMSTPSVMEETIALAKEEDLELYELPAWYDVDDRKSLLRLVEELDQNNKTNAVYTHRFLQQESIRLIIMNGG
ncbi:TIGR04282 family arsenosugar biosynthesis glycosyltransferase [Chloroflexota bacterium]